MFPSKKTLDKTLNDINHKASSLIKFQSSPKKDVTNPKKEKYKTIKESAKPMYSKARLTMDGSGLRDHQPKIHKTNRQLHIHTRQRQSSLGESDNSSKNSRNSSFEHEESDEDHSLEEQVKNNEPIPISLECKYNKSSMIKQESIELSLKTDHTPKLNEDYFLVRTYQRGGSRLVKVNFTEEEKEILKRQKEEKEILKQQKEEIEMLNRQNEEEEILRKQNDKQTQFNNSKEPVHQEINQIIKSTKILRTDSIRSETDSMKDFTDFCHSRIDAPVVQFSSVEIENSNKNDIDDITTTHQENCQSVSFEDDFDLLHIMDDSGKIVWNSLAEKYDVGPFIWYDNSVLRYTNNQDYNTEDISNNVSVVKPVDIKQQSNIDIMLNNENLDIPEVILPKRILEDNNDGYLDNTPSGFRLEVQSPDPSNYMDSFVSNQHLIHNSELSNNNLA